MCQLSSIGRGPHESESRPHSALFSLNDRPFTSFITTNTPLAKLETLSGIVSRVAVSDWGVLFFAWFRRKKAGEIARTVHDA